MCASHASQQPKQYETSWTILLYIAADGLLANFAVESLKQLNQSYAMPYGPDDVASVVVGAQFAVDAPGGQQIPRYIFDNTTSGSIAKGFVGYFDAPAGTTERQALTSFLQWAFSQPRLKSDHYVLILWGHGPELLMQPPAANQLDDPSGDPAANNDILYLTPQDLHGALTEGMPEKKKLDIIGFDACSMSMFEMAYEIRDSACYMVASQEDVPDPSFPYHKLVQLFRGKGNDTEKLIKDGIAAFVAEYQDYIANAVTGMKPVMLSGFRLDCCEPLRSALQSLACALWAGRCIPNLSGLLVQARASSRDFVSGLYVDLDDFCNKLYRLLSIGEPDAMPKYMSCESKKSTAELCSHWKNNIRWACQEVIRALSNPSTPGSIILSNSSIDPDCHGISLYFPYLTHQQYAQLAQPMVKGGRDTGTKGLSSIVNRGVSCLLMSGRRDLIVVTEGYYEDLQLALDTGWYRFIGHQWSKILAQSAPEQLDYFYSAQQCAVNLGRTKVKRNTDKYPCPYEPPEKPDCRCGD